MVVDILSEVRACSIKSLEMCELRFFANVFLGWAKAIFKKVLNPSIGKLPFFSISTTAESIFGGGLKAAGGTFTTVRALPTV